MARRNNIFEKLKYYFALYGFSQIETPAMENLETLTGKYGDEGDQLIFKILNSGDYLHAADAELLSAKNSKKITYAIAEKALRYDLTVPFARYVVQHRNDITFPFRRFQIQQVWRADRPQKARYREFYQCDADIIGTHSLLSEVELIKLTDDVFTSLGINVIVKLNNRKVLASIAEVIGETERFSDITVAIDKLDKIGIDKAKEELTSKGLSENAITKLASVLNFKGNIDDKLSFIKTFTIGSEMGKKGVEELEFILHAINGIGLKTAKIELDITLARGLNYYTGVIIEVKAADVSIGSISGGGRYDDLTGIFGMPGMSGVGISFGADRIYDVMEELKLFPNATGVNTKVLFANFGGEEEKYCLSLLFRFRMEGISSEIYPENVKFKKQFGYADSCGIPFVAIAGEEERSNGAVSLKNMKTGEQSMMSVEEAVEKLKIFL